MAVDSLWGNCVIIFLLSTEIRQFSSNSSCFPHNPEPTSILAIIGGRSDSLQKLEHQIAGSLRGTKTQIREPAIGWERLKGTASGYFRVLGMDGVSRSEAFDVTLGSDRPAKGRMAKRLLGRMARLRHGRCDASG